MSILPKTHSDGGGGGCSLILLHLLSITFFDKICHTNSVTIFLTRDNTVLLEIVFVICL